MVDQHSHYEELVHPNMVQEDKTLNSDFISIYGSKARYDQRAKRRNCRYFFSKLDYEILKPMLIYKYDREEMHRQDDFLEMIDQDKNLLGSIYGKIDFNEIVMRASMVD